MTKQYLGQVTNYIDWPSYVCTYVDILDTCCAFVEWAFNSEVCVILLVFIVTKAVTHGRSQAKIAASRDLHQCGKRKKKRS